MTPRLDPARDWHAERREAALLRLKLQVLAVEVEAFFARSSDGAGGPYATKTARRLEMVAQALTYMVQRAERQLRRLGALADGAT